MLPHGNRTLGSIAVAYGQRRNTCRPKSVLCIHACVCTTLAALAGCFILARCFDHSLPGHGLNTLAPDFMNPVHSPGEGGICDPALLYAAPLSTGMCSGTESVGCDLRPHLPDHSPRDQILVNSWWVLAGHRALLALPSAGRHCLPADSHRSPWSYRDPRPCLSEVRARSLAQPAGSRVGRQSLSALPSLPACFRVIYISM